MANSNYHPTLVREIFYLIEAEPAGLSRQTWTNLRAEFDKLHPEFFYHIKSCGIRITKKECQLLMLEKTHFDTAQIAAALGVIATTVITIRYRLRRKLGITGETNIIHYLENDAINLANRVA